MRLMAASIVLLVALTLAGGAALAATVAEAAPLERQSYAAWTQWETCRGAQSVEASPRWTTFEPTSTGGLRRAPQKSWRGVVVAYAWATDISGTSWVDGVSSDIDIAFDDLYDKLEYAFMGYVEVQYERWSFAVDVTTIALESTSTTPALQALVETRIDQTVLDLRLGYAIKRCVVGESRWGSCCYPRVLQLDAILGARYWDQYQKMRLTVPGAAPRTFSDNLSWWDPYIGARLRWQFAKRWGLTVYGDIGGFEIGDASDLTWQFQTSLRFHITRAFFVALGYRALSVERITGSGANKNGYDATQHGPILGLGLTF